MRMTASKFIWPWEFLVFLEHLKEELTEYFRVNETVVHKIAEQPHYIFAWIHIGF